MHSSLPYSSMWYSFIKKKCAFLFIFKFLPVPHGLWDLSFPIRIEPESPALEGRVLTIGLPGESSTRHSWLWNPSGNNLHSDFFSTHSRFSTFSMALAFPSSLLQYSNNHERNPLRPSSGLASLFLLWSSFSPLALSILCLLLTTWFLPLGPNPPLCSMFIEPSSHLTSTDDVC